MRKKNSNEKSFIPRQRDNGKYNERQRVNKENKRCICLPRSLAKNQDKPMSGKRIDQTTENTYGGIGEIFLKLEQARRFTK